MSRLIAFLQSLTPARPHGCPGRESQAFGEYLPPTTVFVDPLAASYLLLCVGQCWRDNGGSVIDRWQTYPTLPAFHCEPQAVDGLTLHLTPRDLGPGRQSRIRRIQAPLAGPD